MARARRSPPALERAALRLALTLFASLVTAVYLAAISHMTFVAHAVCAEHGKLVHVQAAPAAPAAAGAASPIASESPSPPADEHDHCLFGTAQPVETTIASAPVRLVPGTEPEVSAPPPAQVRSPAPALLPPPIALLLLSPKSSPPA